METMGFEEKIDQDYRTFAKWAERYHYTFTRPSVTVGGLPCVLFLGNHSSGKSSLINWVMGGEPIQDTGLAPTDDGFTVLLYGEEEEDVLGPAALKRLPKEFITLERFGPEFLQHLRVRIRPRAFLKNATLIDSPGMIDTAEGSVSRGYDFAGAVRRFAELSDMIFFLFDPEKPGTTGETVSVFSKCLQGMEFKLRVLLNKCDTFTSLYDFARAYGTLCWNLARVLHTKDLPKIYTTYMGEEKVQEEKGLPLADFNRHRKEFLAILSESNARRADNVLAAAHADFTGLSIRMRLVDRAAWQLFKLKIRRVLLGCLGVAAFAALLLFLMAKLLGTAPFPKEGAPLGPVIGAWVITGIITICILYACFVWNNYATLATRRRLARDLDDDFEREYRESIAIETRDDLRQFWATIRAETKEVVERAPLHLPLFGKSRRQRVETAARETLKG
ncbi:MAG: hypothetical protein J6334_03385 [Kiritimatiellae bacterium]|nr:hypothetical protein [Kiritimatiellia bacterium]